MAARKNFLRLINKLQPFYAFHHLVVKLLEVFLRGCICKCRWPMFHLFEKQSDIECSPSKSFEALYMVGVFLGTTNGVLSSEDSALLLPALEGINI